MQLIAATLLFFLNTMAFAQLRGQVSGDANYFIYEDPHAQYIYPAEYRALVPIMSENNEIIHSTYKNEFNWTLDQKPFYILYSSQNQNANGYATHFPALHAAFYGSGFELINEMTASSWLNILLIHETAHLYQTDLKHGYSKSLKDLLGVSEIIPPTSFLPPFTYMQNPNIFLPTLLIEGNATFNEGRFGNGGRLYNGATRSLFLQFVKSQKLTSARLLNDHLDFPYGREKYWFGGYFFLYLDEKYKEQNPNLFFNTQAHNKVNPLQINSTFLTSYNKTYDDLFSEWQKSWSEIASSLRKLSEAPLVTSMSHGGLVADQKQIQFLVSDLKSPPQAIVINKSNLSETRQRLNLPLGKLFVLDDGQFVTPNVLPTQNNQRQTGLFAQGFNLIRESLNKFVMDVDGSRWLWIDAIQAFHETKLYDGEKYVDQTQSSAIYGEDHAVYYFKQNHKTRTLFRDGQPLFSYQGYYGYPVAALSSNEIYFIGPTASGSGLFVWRPNTFEIVVPSDRVIDAAWINTDQMLVTEITTHGYEYKITNKRPLPEVPFEYKYPYENQKTFEMLSNLQPEVTAPSGAQTALPPSTPSTNHKERVALVAKEEKPYDLVQQWRFLGADPFVFFGADTPIVFQLNARFGDILGDHLLNFMTSNGSYGEWSAGLQYENLKNVINWDILARYKSVATLDTSDAEEVEVLERYDSWVGAIGFDYTFFKRPLIESSLTSHLIYQDEKAKLPISDLDQKYFLLSQVNWKYSLPTLLGFSSYRSAGLQLSHEHHRSIHDDKVRGSIYGAQASLSQDLFRETYLSASIQYANADSQNPILPFRRSPDDTPYPAAHNILRRTAYHNTEFVDLQKVSLSLKQALPLSFYFARFPIGLRRMALISEYNDFTGRKYKNNQMDHIFYEVGWGAEFEILLAHRFPSRFQIMSFENSATHDQEALFTLGLSSEF